MRTKFNFTPNAIYCLINMMQYIESNSIFTVSYNQVCVIFSMKIKNKSIDENQFKLYENELLALGCSNVRMTNAPGLDPMLGETPASTIYAIFDKQNAVAIDSDYTEDFKFVMHLRDRNGDIITEYFNALDAYIQLINQPSWRIVGLDLC